jgi:hypothetical protein
MYYQALEYKDNPYGYTINKFTNSHKHDLLEQTGPHCYGGWKGIDN